MDIVLVPGLWLDGASWGEVVPALEASGHRIHPITLPGMESRGADRASVTIDDAIEAVVAAIDSADEPVVLVGHSAGAGIASAAVDRRPERVARAIYIGGFPSPDGEALISGFDAVNGEVPFPGWDEFGDEDKADLDAAAQAAFEAATIPSPEHVVHGAVRMTDPRRYDVPVTKISTEYSSEQLRSWIDAGEPPVQEFTKLTDVTYLDLPTGHWPQVTKPRELAALILAQPPLGGGGA